MAIFSKRNAMSLAAACAFLLFIYCVRIYNKPPTVRKAHHLVAGSCEIAPIIDAYKRRHRVSPTSVEFESTGPVEVYLTQVSLTGSMKHKNYIEKLRKDFESGQVPKTALALSGRRGRFDPTSLPRNISLPNYLLLMRSVKDVTVEVVIRY